MRNKDFFSTGEAANITGLSQKTIINYCDQGKIEASQARITNYRRIPRDSLLKFMKINDIPFDNLNDKIKILIVDDEPDVIDAIKWILDKDDRFILDMSLDGYDGCIKAGCFKPDIIILDLLMPGVDGFEVCKRIKANHEIGSAEFIILTGYKTDENVLKLKNLGVSHVLSKPFDTNELLLALEIICNFNGTRN